MVTLAGQRIAAITRFNPSVLPLSGSRASCPPELPRSADVGGAVASTRWAVELDATVWRQDLSVSLATLAREEGVRWFSIGSDAHNELELEFLPFGMATAARAGIERDRILNYRSIDFVRSWPRELNEEARIEHEA